MSTKRSLPTVGKFQTEEVERYVNDRIYMKNPVTWFGWVSGLLVAGGGFAFVQLLEFWMIATASGGLIVSIGSLTRDLMRRDSIRLDYLKKLNRQLENQADELAKWLDVEFSSLGHSQADDLLLRLQTHMTTFEEVLSQKFPPGTKTYEHFYGAAETLQIQTLNVLKDTATQIKVVGAIDIVGAQRSFASAPEGEKQSHQRRIDLHAEGQQRLAELLQQAEAAVAGLAELKQEVANIRGDGAKEFDSFIQNVNQLAQRASGYRDEQTIN